MSASFSPEQLVCACSEGLLSALTAKMYVPQHLSVGHLANVCCVLHQ
jgi:hypothetical protein